MALKHLLLNLASGPDSAVRLDLATRLAKSHDAHLTGLFVRYRPPPRVMPGTGSAEFTQQLRSTLEEMTDSQKEEENAVVSAFRNAVGEVGVSAECCIEDGADAGGVIPHLVHYARTADLVILGKTGENGSSTAHDVLFGGGVPVVVVPRSVQDGVGRHVAIAWNGSREAARAVNDAMPIIEQAAQVTVLCINQKTPGQNIEPGEELVRHLRHHGIEARTDNLIRKGQAVGDVMISRLADLGADLLVMGAWGHSRLREFVLGGVTKRILEQTSTPVLMSH